MERSGGGGQGGEEGRIAPRRRQLKSAVVIFNDAASLMDCTLRNISDTGAGIECENSQQIPDNVVLKDLPQACGEWLLALQEMADDYGDGR